MKRVSSSRRFLSADFPEGSPIIRSTTYQSNRFVTVLLKVS
jgi:hypothetical protein